MLTPEEALAIYHAGAETTVRVLCELSRQVDVLQARTVELEARVKDLEGQLAKNSRNSSKPPSSDGPKKPPRSLRQRGKRKPGGQKGHPGHTLEMVDDPDHTVVHRVETCSACGCDLTDEPSGEVEKRQVFDLPPPQGLESTEHQAESKDCPRCGHVNKAAFPTGVNAPVQYGLRVKALGAYLREYQLLPSQRTCELLWDVHGFRMSEGTLATIIESLSDILEEPVEKIADAIKSSAVAHFDETSCSVKGKRHWLHVSSTQTLTHYHIHKKRGNEATDEIGILPEFSGRAIHDHWKPYFTYKCEHGLCNAHHLRELIFVHEHHGQQWAEHMIDCLLSIKEAVDLARSETDLLAEEQIDAFESRYQQIIDAGYSENPLPEEPSGKKKKRGRRKKTKPRNLLERLDEYRKETLAFMYDFNVPFDNNQAERDARMTKVQKKISGTFRSEDGATAFCRIRGYVSTARKNGLNALDALQNALGGTPFLPAGCVTDPPSALVSPPVPRAYVFPGATHDACAVERRSSDGQVCALHLQEGLHESALCVPQTQ